VILPDVNVLIYALRSDTKDHARYRNWLMTVVNGDAPYGMSPQVLCSVIRVCTHRKAFPRPTPPDEAFAFCQVLLDQPHCQAVFPGPEHWSIFQRLSHQAKVSGTLVQDAWFAALAIENGCEWITTDRDYARFTGLKWRHPF
jgi:uncharacterized protein